MPQLASHREGLPHIGCVALVAGVQGQLNETAFFIATSRQFLHTFSATLVSV